ncbi:MAG: hypothetical protein ACPF9W_10290 [Nocardioides sp.]
MSSPGLPPDSSAGSPTGGDPGRRWLRRKEARPSLEELEARIAEQTAAAERFATLRAAAEKAATEQAAERMIAEETATTALRGRSESDTRLVEAQARLEEALQARSAAEAALAEAVSAREAAEATLNEAYAARQAAERPTR